MTHAPERCTPVRRRRSATMIALAAALAMSATPAVSQVEVPSRSGGAAAVAVSPSAAPAPGAERSAPAASTRPTQRSVPVRLSIGSRGAAVKALQRQLRRRGIRIAVDGAFGPATRRAVRIMQKRLRLKVTGVATAPLMRRLGLATRVRVALSDNRPRPNRGTQYLQVFPVAGQDYTYFDDFGAPRHQGSHEGTDIMADKGTPLVAVVDATVDRVQRTERGLGGLYVWLERADGTEYYYAHMAAVAPGLREGQSVRAGDILGTVGNTGDARHGAAHLHFEIRPRGVGSINPYTHLVAVDGKRSGTAALRR